MEYFEYYSKVNVSNDYTHSDRDVDNWAAKSLEESRQALSPLIKTLKAYDQARRSLETKGGYSSDFNKVSQVLMSSIELGTPFGTRQIRLVDPEKINQALRQVNWDLKLQVRQLTHRMPVYYIGRTREDWWAEYSLVVEDIYQSHGYPVQDERFYRLMHAGHEIYFLRLAHLRDVTTHFLALRYPNRLHEIDKILYEAGRYVFQHAWHEDQRLAMLISQYFGLTEFKHAIELLYLCLSADLCELRSAVSPILLELFEIIYPQPAIRQVLENLCDLDGQQLNNLPRTAISTFKYLTKAFSRFLKTEIAWRGRKWKIPLWKLIYSNLGRMNLVVGRIETETSLEAACRNLEKASSDIVSMLLEKRIGSCH